MTEPRTRTSGSSPSTDPCWKMPERHRRQAERAAAEIQAWPAWMRVSAVPPREGQEEDTMTEVFDIGDGPDGTPSFDVCADCGHYRGEHDGTVCCCVIVNAKTRTSRQCDCEGFLDA